MGILPSNIVEEAQKSSKSGRFVKLEPGENRFRILDVPTSGWVVWENQKPTRYKDKSDVPANADDAKYFWFFPVWMNDSVKFLEVPQKSVLSELAFFDQNEDWGELFNYDIIVNRTGDGMETQYRTAPVPKKPLSKDGQEAWAKIKPDYKPEELFKKDGVIYVEPVNESNDELPF